MTVDYTYNSTIYVPDHMVGQHYEWRIFSLAAILQARLDVVSGVTDAGVTVEDKPGVRSDALAFFTDGRFDALLEFSGAHSSDVADGVGDWVMVMARWVRRNPDCPPGTDAEVVTWGHVHGLFNNDEVWREAAGNDVQVVPARRLMIGLLD
jgi:hypothetical protein